MPLDFFIKITREVKSRLKKWHETEIFIHERHKNINHSLSILNNSI